MSKIKITYKVFHQIEHCPMKHGWHSKRFLLGKDRHGVITKAIALPNNNGCKFLAGVTTGALTGAYRRMLSAGFTAVVVANVSRSDNRGERKVTTGKYSLVKV
jgi:hypothetical protein